MTIWTELVRDGADASDAAVGYFIINVADGATSADSPPITLDAAISADGATASDAAVAQLALHDSSSSDGATSSDTLALGFTTAASDGANASDAAAFTVDSRVSDGATASDSATTIVRQTQLVADGALATDAIGQAFSYGVSDGATTTDGFAGIAIDHAAADGATAADTALVARLTTQTVSDAATSADATASHVIAHESLSDGAHAKDAPLFNRTAVMWTNTQTQAAARWLNLPANSFVIHRGALLGASQAGIMAFGANTDAGTPIVATAKGDLTDFGTAVRKLYDGAYAAAIAAGNLQLRVATEGGVWTYLAQNSPGKYSNVFFQLGRGLFSRYARFQLSNPDGANFQVRDVRVSVGVTTRLR